MKMAKRNKRKLTRMIIESTENGKPGIKMVS